MEIVSFEQLDSTQNYLIEALERSQLQAPVAVITSEQTGGIGSRENLWHSSKGDLLFSFALPLSWLLDDLPLGSSSIYFAYIMKEILSEFQSDIWLKWPNDIYYHENKIGGVVTKMIGKNLVCGMGVNLKKNEKGFEALHIGVEPTFVFKMYLNRLDKKPQWKHIFRKYKLEFNYHKNISTHIMGQKISLHDAVLCDDGSLLINKKRIYSLR